MSLVASEIAAGDIAECGLTERGEFRALATGRYYSLPADRLEATRPVFEKALSTFIELAANKAKQTRSGLPAFVVNEFEAYLDCGVLSKGFIRLLCKACRLERFVGFSCKRELSVPPAHTT